MAEAQTAQRPNQPVPPPQAQKPEDEAPAVEAAAPEKRKPIRPSKESNFHLRETKQNEYIVFVETGVSFRDVLQPEFWAHVAMKVPIGSKIVVQPEDYSYYAELLCVGSFGQALDVRVILGPVEIKGARFGDSPMALYKVANMGPIRLWEVHQRDTGRVLASKLTSEQAAQTWVSEHFRSLSLRG